MKSIGTSTITVLLISLLIATNSAVLTDGEAGTSKLYQENQWSTNWSIEIIAGRIITPWSWRQSIELRSFLDSRYFHIAWRVVDTPLNSSSLYYSRLNLATGQWDIQSYKVGNDASPHFAITGNEEYLWFAWISETNASTLLYRVWNLSGNTITDQTTVEFGGKLSSIQMISTPNKATVVVQNDTQLFVASFSPELVDSSIKRLFQADSFALFANGSTVLIAYINQNEELFVRNIENFSEELELGTRSNAALFQTSSQEGFVLVYRNQNSWTIDLQSPDLVQIAAITSEEIPREISAYLEYNATDPSASTWGFEIGLKDKNVVAFQNVTVEIDPLPESLVIIRKSYPIIVYPDNAVYARAWGINDTDSDSLPDWYELWIGTDPSKGDTDEDLIPDPLEAKYTLEVSVKDALKDLDADDLTNSEEIAIGTDPYMADTDLDFLSDSLEVRNPPLSPVNHSDGFLDFDNDGLATYLEFGIGTNFSLPDSDGDGLLDGEEYFMGTNPLAPDGFRDPDGDGLSSYWEIALGLSPNFENTGKYQGGDTILLTWFYVGLTVAAVFFGIIVAVGEEKVFNFRRTKSDS